MPPLSDQEKLAISRFTGDPVMFEAVRKVLLRGIYTHGTLKEGEESPDPAQNFALRQVYTAIMQSIPISDAELGQNLRAQAVGIQIVEAAFKILTDMKPEKASKKTGKGNPAL